MKFENNPQIRITILNQVHCTKYTHLLVNVGCANKDDLYIRTLDVCSNKQEMERLNKYVKYCRKQSHCV